MTSEFDAGIFAGIEVPLGLGLLRLTTHGRPSDIDAIALIRLALNQGIRVLDTADVYCLGEDDLHYGEHLIRQALRSWKGPKREIRVLTKAGLTRPGGQWVPNGRPDHLQHTVDASLRALGVERLFLLQLHVRDPNVDFDETLGALADLQAEGKVEHVGLCNVSPEDVQHARQHFVVASIQNELSVLNRSSAADGTLQLAQESGIPFLAHRPLGGHARTEHIGRDNVLGAVADRSAATRHEVALAVLRNVAGNILPLVGATRASSIRSSLRALELDFDVSDKTSLAVQFPFESAVPQSTQSTSDQQVTFPPPGSAPEIVVVMGIQGAGKSESVETYVNAGYARLNRDLMGGTLKDLIPRLRQLLASGQNRVILDNTYPSRESRGTVMTAAQQYGVPVRCVFLQTSMAEARINVVLRMLAKYGLPLGPEEMQACVKSDPNLPPPQALNRWMTSFEPPTTAEGFTKVDVVPFVRRHNPAHTKKALLLDVDGTLRKTRSGEFYPRHPDDVELLPRRHDVLREWVDSGYQLFFVSNQSGVASGRVALPAVQAAFMRTAQLLQLPVTEIAYCPHPSRPVGCFCRKPMPGLGVYLAQRHGLDVRELIMVGDMESDQQFAAGLGIQYINADTFFA